MPTADRTIVDAGVLYLPGQELPEHVYEKLKKSNPRASSSGGRKLGDSETSTVEQVLDWVGGDHGRALRAQEYEAAGQGRTTLLSALAEIVSEAALDTGTDVAEALNG